MEIDKLLELKLIKKIERRDYLKSFKVNVETFMGEYMAILNELKHNYNCPFIAFCNFSNFNLKVPSPTIFYGVKTFNLKMLNNEMLLCKYSIETDNIDLDNIFLITF